MEIDREMLLEAFAEQSAEGLDAMEESLLALEAQPGDAEHLNTIFRICHTLKGDAAILELPALTQFAHVLEDLLDALRADTVLASAEVITILLRTVDAMREMVEDALDGRTGERPEHQALLRDVKGELPGESAESTTSTSADRAAASDAEVEEPDITERVRALERAQTLRVRVDTLDRLLNLTGELAIGRSRLTELLTGSRAIDHQELTEAHQMLDPLFVDLQHEVLQLRMIPVGTLFRRHLRTVRDLAVRHDKIARLEIEGEDAELDTTVIEQLRDPLAHMVRNAIAHGIESPAEREALGKDPCGCIVLRAYREGTSIVVQITDDGAGLDRERIRSRAESLGLAPDGLTDAQLDRMVFEPGFSTVDDATLSSGRGVGMDVVRRNIETLHGSVSIDSTAGEGTTVTIRLPLTLAIIEGFSVGVGDQVYILPLAAVSECVDLPADTGVRRTGVIELRGSALPYIGLRELLGTPGQPVARQSIVVVQDGSKRGGLAVDTIYGETQAVIKPLGRLLRGLRGTAGSTVLGDGRVALILDVPELLRRAAGLNTPGAPPTPAADRPEDASAQTVAGGAP